MEGCTAVERALQYTPRFLAAVVKVGRSVGRGRGQGITGGHCTFSSLQHLASHLQVLGLRLPSAGASLPPSPPQSPLVPSFPLHVANPAVQVVFWELHQQWLAASLPPSPFLLPSRHPPPQVVSRELRQQWLEDLFRQLL